MLRLPRARPLRVADRRLLLLATAGRGVVTRHGDYPLSAGEVVATLIGRRPGEPVHRRDPAAAARAQRWSGAAFGIAGAIFQEHLAQPARQPRHDRLHHGLGHGRADRDPGDHGGAGQIALGAVAGGLVTAVVVYLLALRGGVQGYRLVLVGIGVGAMLLAVNDYLITRARATTPTKRHTGCRQRQRARLEDAWPVAAALAVAERHGVALRSRYRALSGPVVEWMKRQTLESVGGV